MTDLRFVTCGRCVVRGELRFLAYSTWVVLDAVRTAQTEAA